MVLYWMHHAVRVDENPAAADGFEAMDQHFCTAPFAENMPVILGLLGIRWRRRKGLAVC